jgi:hypothetical protein
MYLKPAIKFPNCFCILYKKEWNSEDFIVLKEAMFIKLKSVLIT